MAGRKPSKLVLQAKDKAVLRKLLCDGQTSWKVARRAQILLGRTDEQQPIVDLGERIGQNPATVWRVCQRYRQGGLDAALYDAPRSGHPRVFSP